MLTSVVSLFSCALPPVCSLQLYLAILYMHYKCFGTGTIIMFLKCVAPWDPGPWLLLFTTAAVQIINNNEYYIIFFFFARLLSQVLGSSGVNIRGSLSVVTSIILYISGSSQMLGILSARCRASYGSIFHLLCNGLNNSTRCFKQRFRSQISNAAIYKDPSQLFLYALSW